jgi:hypothetical protein
MEEPSVLDYLKSILMPWKYPRIEIPPESPTQGDPAPILLAEAVSVLAATPAAETSPAEEISLEKTLTYPFPWRSLLSLLLALVGQAMLGPRLEGEREWMLGVAILIISVGLSIWSALAGEWTLAPLKEKDLPAAPQELNLINTLIGGAGVFLALVAFWIFGTLKFNILNVALLLLALDLIIQGLKISEAAQPGWFSRFLKGVQPQHWAMAKNASGLAALAGIALVVFFRFYHLNQVPPEMNSDHAEKFLDVLGILAGQTSIFFARNGGREALQFYLVAGLNKFFGFPLTFLTLKLVTSVIGFLALPFLYLLGKEIGGARVGWLAFLFAGIAYWPNVVSRFGLRLPFYMFFSAAMLFYLVRGIRTDRRNDFITAGVMLGLSFYGYSADRILPGLVIVAILLFLVHSQSKGHRLSVVASLTALILISVVLFLPLLRYILAEPQGFFFRTFSRMGSWEVPISDPIPVIFIKNVGRALAMFSWDNGEVWPISIPHYPALSVVSGALFYSGAGLVLIRYLRQRHWLDLFLLLSIPLLMLPSILSLAFPSENPNLYRTGGAIVPVFLMIALALDSLMKAVARSFNARGGLVVAWALALSLLAFNSFQDYKLVFNTYDEQYLMSSWNSSEMGQVAHDFISKYQIPISVWVVGFPNWVDTRLVANNAGFPGRDFELKPENISKTLSISGPKLFIINPDDQDSQGTLRQLYPEGELTLYKSKVATKDFLIFIVLPVEG